MQDQFEPNQDFQLMSLTESLTNYWQRLKLYFATATKHICNNQVSNEKLLFFININLWKVLKTNSFSVWVQKNCNRSFRTWRLLALFWTLFVTLRKGLGRVVLKMYLQLILLSWKLFSVLSDTALYIWSGPDYVNLVDKIS